MINFFVVLEIPANTCKHLGREVAMWGAVIAAIVISLVCLFGWIMTHPARRR
jgi:hypothetical protein